MVAYQGEVTFEHAGSGGLGRMMKKAMTGEGTTLMKMAGSGEVFLADEAQDIHLIYLENDFITVNGPNLLAFDSDIDWDIKRVQGGSGAMAGGLYNMELRGTGWVAILSDGPPVLLNVAAAPTFADAQAAITWSSGVTTSIRTDFKMKNLIGKGSGETIQLAFGGQGWVLVQPSEGRVAAPSSGGGGGGLGQPARRLGGLRRGRRRPRRRRRPPARSPGTTSAPRAACRSAAWRSGSSSPALRAPQSASSRSAPASSRPDRGQLVDEPRRALGVRAGDHERLLAEQLQPAAEHVRARSRRARPGAR